MNSFRLITLITAVVAFPTSEDRPCDAQLEACLMSFTCGELPFCDADGSYYTGPVCDATNACSCIDAKTGHTSVSSEGIQLVSGIYLPDNFFGGWMSGTDFDCALFSSDAGNSPSLTDPSLGLPEELLASIAGL